MTRLLTMLLIVLAVILTSCDMNILCNYKFENFHFDQVDFANKDQVTIQIDGTWFCLSNKTEDEKIMNITLWVYNNIKYVHDTKKNVLYGTKDWYQTPEETLANGYGDCEDFGILVAAIAYSQLHIKMSLLRLKKGDDGHCVACYNNNVIECFNSETLPTRGNVDFVFKTEKFINYITYCENNGYTWVETILFDNIVEKISERHLEAN